VVAVAQRGKFRRGMKDEDREIRSSAGD
jgi:hypothetical protein